MSAEEIVRGLRRMADTSDDYGGYTAEECERAIALIESLTAQLAASQQRERAAVEDIGQACATCAHSKKASCPWEGTYHHRGEHGEKIGVCNAWQWRGHQAAKEETKQ